MIRVEVMDGEVDSAIRRFRQSVANHGLIWEMRRRSYYASPKCCFTSQASQSKEASQEMKSRLADSLERDPVLLGRVGGSPARS